MVNGKCGHPQGRAENYLLYRKPFKIHFLATRCILPQISLIFRTNLTKPPASLSPVPRLPPISFPHLLLFMPAKVFSVSPSFYSWIGTHSAFLNVGVMANFMST